ncbi:MAG TPA: hypothetical protein VGO80_09940 [Solirubrobacteraceae bacterium]|jgi:hypothetical protein|nr:hypothetical protein [Solirubrobacteraceae bacterium]
MSDGDTISASFTGDVSGQVAVGKNIAQHQVTGTAAVTQDELAQLRQAFAQLRAQVAEQAPPERQAAAVERIDELEQATLAEKPDPTTIAYVGRWFQTNLPRLAGAVTGLVIHPLVGRIVGAAGEAIVAEFRGGS